LVVLFPRELLVAVGTTWSAYFNCSVQGTDPGPIGHLSQTLGCTGLAIHCVTGGDRAAPVYKPPATSFELFGAAPRGRLNAIRSVACVSDGSRWEFQALGVPQPFEEAQAYQSQRVRDRFTPEMLQRYCRSVVGIDVFDAANYGHMSVLIETDAVISHEAKRLSLDEAQRWLGIAPRRLA